MPNCEAVILQVPAATSVTVAPAIVHVPEVVEVNTTGNPDDALAVRLNAGSVVVLSGKAPKVMV